MQIILISSSSSNTFVIWPMRERDTRRMNGSGETQTGIRYPEECDLFIPVSQKHEPHLSPDEM